jgi:hypothetical protein
MFSASGGAFSSFPEHAVKLLLLQTSSAIAT